MMRESRPARHIARHGIGWSVWAAMLVATPTAALAAQSIESFIELESKWPQLIGVPFTLEGRYSLVGKNVLQFENCDLFFRSKQEFPDLTRQGRRVEVSGRLAERHGRLYFAVAELKQLPGDLQTFHSRRAQLVRAEPKQWYELGDWARRRSEFYDDEQLAAKAESAYRDGIHESRNQLPLRDWQGLLALSEKAAELGLPDSFRLELVHEAYRWAWEEARADHGRMSLERLKQEIATNLPGSREPLDAEPQVKAAYIESPLSVYRSTPASDRKQLHRLLYTDVVWELIGRQAKDDGSNGFEIAGQIEKELPERQADAERFRVRELQHRLKHVAVATRSEMLELAELFERRKQPEQASAARRRWLEGREQRLRQDGPQGLLQLAEEYTALAGDEDKAARLLVKAYELSAGSAEIAHRLQRIGYRLRDGQWLKAGDVETESESRIERAMRVGRVVTGMTGSQVLKTHGRPVAVTRLASQTKITEIWVYGSTSGAGFAVELQRRASRDEATVVDVEQLK